MERLFVVDVVAFVDNGVTYRFSDGSVGTHQTLKDGRGFLYAGPLDTVNAQQLLAVVEFTKEDKKETGWL